MTPEPLRLSLEEAVMRVSNGNCSLICRGNSDDYPASRWLVIGQYANTLGEGATWPEAVSQALGVPVVERDEAAELKEAVRSLFTAVHELGASDDSVLIANHNEALAKVRRLAGMEEG